MNVTDGDRERDQMERADKVYARIEVLSDDLAENLAVTRFLALQLQVREALVHKLQSEIQELHVERNAIFHEDDDRALCDCGVVNGPHIHRAAEETTE